MVFPSRWQSTTTLQWESGSKGPLPNVRSMAGQSFQDNTPDVNFREAKYSEEQCAAAGKYQELVLVQN